MSREVIKLGRSIENTLVVGYPKISSKHCQIRKVGEGEFIIEDLGSTNGTFVNGRRIKQTMIKPDDELKLADMVMDAKLVLSVFDLKSDAEKIDYSGLEKQTAIKSEFLNLKKVYEKYVSDKKMLMMGSSLTSTGLRAGLSLIPYVGTALGIVATGMTGTVQAKMYELDEKFKMDYICPVCFRFLGNEPFDNLEKRGTCIYCKAKWKKDF
jgi:hypothetical protein